MDTQSTATAQVASVLPEAYLIQLGFGPLVAQALYVTARLGVADLLVEKPLGISDLAATTNTNERALYRVMRSLASVGVFNETDSKVFALNENAQPLRSDVPNSMRSGIIFFGEEWHWRVWGNMLYSVETGKPAWEKVHGAEVFDYLRSQPKQS